MTLRARRRTGGERRRLDSRLRGNDGVGKRDWRGEIGHDGAAIVRFSLMSTRPSERRGGGEDIPGKSISVLTAPSPPAAVAQQRPFPHARRAESDFAGIAGLKIVHAGAP